jgi:hypothetical protein
MHTAYKTILTASGGLAKPLISVISCLFNFFNAYAAACNAGIALLS